MTIDLGGTRRLHVHENNEIIITDICSKKCAFFTGPRWKRFVGMMTDIDEHVQLVSAGMGTDYMQPIGGTWCVSVNNTFPTVDIRRWYNKTRVGISLKPTIIKSISWKNLLSIYSVYSVSNCNVSCIDSISVIYYHYRRHCSYQVMLI